jgi:DNA-binding beta-propeller fold protein YncE
VANAGSNSVTELNATTGALIRVISGERYQLNSGGLSVAIAADGNRVWVPNANGNSVTEINAATGALIRVITSLPNFSFAITPDAAGVWLVTNAGVKGVGDTGPDGSVAELRAASGQLIRNISGPPFQDSSPGGAITADGNRVWAAGTYFYSTGGWVSELSAATGAMVRVISG